MGFMFCMRKSSKVTNTIRGATAHARALVRAFTLALVLGLGFGVHGAQAEKYAAIVVDAKTGKTLFSRHADAPRYPASLTKIMTLYMLFEALEQGRVNMNTRLRISPKAAAQPPSRLGLRAGNRISVKNAILALITKSANDVACAVAEHLGRTEAKFARRMTAKARALGMRNTRFRNASGLPHRGQRTTARDMARLGRAIQKRFPHYYRLFKTRSFTYQGRRYRNHNRLLGRVAGVNGIKTGYIRASGFNLVTNTQRNRRHIVSVVMGGRSARSRDAHMRKLITRYLPRASRGRYRAAAFPRLRASLSEAIAVRVPRPDPRKRAAAARRHAQMKAPPGTEQTADNVAGAALSIHAQPSVTSVLPVPRPLSPAPVPRPLDPVSVHPAPTPALSGAAIPLPPETIPQGDMTPSIDASAQPYVLKERGSDQDSIVTESLGPGARLGGDSKRTGWAIQIGALDTPERANAMLEKARSRAGRLLRKGEPFVEKGIIGARIYYRARFAGFTRSRARKVCKALKRKRFSCYAVAL